MPERAEPDPPGVLDRARAGDVAAFETVYHRHSARVFALCLRMAATRADAEDWAQEAWVRAWQRLGSFRGDAKFATWMHRLTLNVILDRMRRRAKRRDRTFGDRTLARAPEARTVELPGERLDLRRAVAALPDGARVVFLLHEVEGYKQREIAERLGVAVGTVKSQLHRARKLLQEALER